MSRTCVAVLVVSLLLAAGLPARSQQAASEQSASASEAAIPTLVNFSGVLTDLDGKPLSGIVGVMFLLYKDQQGGAPLWMETQNVQPNKNGQYSVMLGAASPGGLPADMFTSGEARWLGVQVQGQEEQPRIMLLSVPYALKAGDAATLGGLPASAFLLANQAGPATVNSSAQESLTTSSPSEAPNSAITGSGTVDYIPLWDTTSDILSSVLFQSGTGSSAKIGLNTTTPAATLDVNGGIISRGTLQLPSIGTATASQGYNSQALQLQASGYNGTSAIGPAFQIQTEPAGNNTTGVAGTLNLLYGSSSGQPSETGFKIANNGLVTFVGTQTFPNTVESITASNSGITIGGTKANPTIGINATFADQNYAQLKAANTFTANQTVSGTITATTFSGNGASVTNVNAAELQGLSSSAFAQLAASTNTFTGGVAANSFTGNGAALTNVNAAELGGFTASAFQPAGTYATLGPNTFNGNQSVTGNVSSTGFVSGSGFQIGSNLFAYGSLANTNAFLGFAGNSTTTGPSNTATGVQALSDVTSGSANTASGYGALGSTTSGFENTASGFEALLNNTTGSGNTAMGEFALVNNTTGAGNTGIGAGAGYATDGTLITGSNDTFIGNSSGPSTGSLTNATAIGLDAEVAESNAIVLGSIKGMNNATSNVNVGIGTTSPAYSLDVNGTGHFTQAVTFGSPVTFASGQTFPGAGTITGVTAGAGLSGGGSSGGITLANTGVLSVAAGTGIAVTGGQSPTVSVNTAQVPLLSSSNAFTGNQTVNGNLSATGMVSGSGFQIGSNLFDYGSWLNSNAFLGFAGNTTMTGAANTAVGPGALGANTTGCCNTAAGFLAMVSNTTGDSNTAEGSTALYSNTTGCCNTASGAAAMNNSYTGSYNTASGFAAGTAVDGSFLTGSSNTFVGANSWASTGTLTNATAIGANAEVAASNAMVLGSINGVNGATADTFVGIGTTAPRTKLEIDANAPSAVGPTLTMTNTGGLGEVSMDVNTYTPSPNGTYNPSARILFVDGGSDGYDYSNYMYFDVNKAGAPNNGLQWNMFIDPAGDVSIRGNLSVGGTVSKGGGSFKIDHPLDPENKYLYHSFVESPDMMNIYNGVVMLDSGGSAWITMPDYFEALNRDFRYQLTSMGRPQPSLYIAAEMSGNRFRVAGGKPGGRVSWQVTGIRHDAYANAHRIQVEVEKPPQEQGHYLQPELFGAPPEKQIGYQPPASPTNAVTLKDKAAAVESRAASEVGAEVRR